MTAKAKFREEKTFAMIKPDGVKRGLVGEIIRRIEQRGLKVIACVMFAPTRAQIDRHYPKDAKWIRRLGEKTMIQAKASSFSSSLFSRRSGLSFPYFAIASA